MVCGGWRLTLQPNLQEDLRYEAWARCQNLVLHLEINLTVWLQDTLLKRWERLCVFLIWRQFPQLHRCLRRICCFSLFNARAHRILGFCGIFHCRCESPASAEPVTGAPRVCSQVVKHVTRAWKATRSLVVSMRHASICPSWLQDSLNERMGATSYMMLHDLWMCMLHKDS